MLRLSSHTHTRRQLKDTVLVALLSVVLHGLQVLLVTLEAPGVVLGEGAALAALQPVVEHLRLLQPLQLHLLRPTLDTGTTWKD